MRKLRLILLGASVLGVLAMVLYFGKDYMATNNTVQPPVIHTTAVVKITSDIKRGDKIDSSKYTTIQVQTDVLPKNIIQSANEVNNHYALVDLYAGEYVYSSRITDISPHEGKQRIAINITPLGATAGKLLRGQSVTIRIKKSVVETPQTDPVTGLPINNSNTETQGVSTITTNAEVADVLNDNLQNIEDFHPTTGVKVQQSVGGLINGQSVNEQSQVGTSTTYFIPKYAILWVTPQEADLITKYDEDSGLRLAIN